MTLHHGDCIEVMADMEPESVDAICTDPPYDLTGHRWDSIAAGPLPKQTAHVRGRGGFMGKTWDGTGIAFQRETWEAAYRVAKPSAYLLAFGGTRTVHRMTVALEDAGWIIRDMLVWGYASGFPKGKANLKPAWEPIVMARKPGPLRALAIDACRIPGEPWAAHDATGLASVKFFTDGDAPVIHKEPHNLGRWPANVILTDPIFDGGVEGVVGGGEVKAGVAVGGLGNAASIYGTALDKHDALDMGYGDSGTYSRFFLVPKADRADREPVLDEYAYRLHRERGECGKLSAWEGTDLKPSAPTDSTSPARGISEATSTDDSPSDTSPSGSQPTDPSPRAIRSTTSTATNRTTSSTTFSSSILSPTSGSIPGASSETASGGSPVRSAVSSNGSANPTGISPLRDGPSTGDVGPVTSPRLSSRNVCGRCGKALPRIGTHPTTKPVDLMRHLVRLVTPSGGVVLDPFGGSGTTAVAAELEGFQWILVEREAEYVAIAEARLNGVQRGLGLDVAAPTPRMPNTHPDLSKHQPKVQRREGASVYGTFKGFDERPETANDSY